VTRSTAGCPLADRDSPGGHEAVVVGDGFDLSGGVDGVEFIAGSLAIHLPSCPAMWRIP
jgi:hypothetical protein